VERGLTFAAFARTVDDCVWLLGVEPQFVLDGRGARWSSTPYVAELQSIDRCCARILLSTDGMLRYASEPGPMTADGARTLANAIGLLFGGHRASAGTAVAHRAHTPPHVTSEEAIVPPSRDAIGVETNTVSTPRATPVRNR
jgi:hypothetical protein